MKKIFYISTLASIVLLAAGCGKNTDVSAAKQDKSVSAEAKSVDKTPGDVSLSPEAVKIAGIEVQEVSMRSIQAEFKVPGVVTDTAHGRAIVTPPVAGKITNIFVDPGDHVVAGQAIATLRSSDLAVASANAIEAERGVIVAKAAVQEAKSEVDLANAKVRTARTALARQQEFANTGAFSQPTLQQAQRELNEAEAELESAKQDQQVHGSQVERAERLFTQELISRTELEQARLVVQQDRIRQQKATRQIEIARSTQVRERKIAERGLLNSKEIQSAEAEVRSADLEAKQARIRYTAAISGVASAQKGLQASRVSYGAQAGGARATGGSVTVVAPIGGVVTRRETSLGQAVERTTELCQIENLGSVWVTANVPEKQIALVKKQQPAQVVISAYPNRVFSGEVQVVGSRLDPRSRTMPVQVLVGNASGALRPDMFATVALGVGGNDLGLLVPVSALTEEHEAGGAMVFVEEDKNRFMKKRVVLGRRKGKWVEILTGIEPGAKVVVKGAFTLMSEAKKAELKGDE